MKRIDGPGATQDNLFTEGDPARGVPATVVKADWLNSVQEELGSFIESRGIALDGDDTTQLEQALISLLALKTTIQIRSDDSVVWNGSRLGFTSNIELIFREQEDTIVNRFVVADSPLQFEEGQVLVLRLDKFRSPVDLALQPNYADLEAGQYSIINEEGLSNEQPEEETILFRRRGTDLEIPLLGEVITSGSRFQFGIKTESSAAVPPIGSIIPFYDFDGQATFDPEFWAYCDGSFATLGRGIGRKRLPDLSNRYLIGFGTEGGRDIGGAGWNAAPVGNANHTINLTHSHTVNAHTHNFGNHTHGHGSLRFRTLVFNWNGWNDIDGFDQNGNQIDLLVESGAHGSNTKVATYLNRDITSYTGPGSGSTGPPNRNESGAASPGTDNQLGMQNIQPRSVRVRFIMRIQ